MTPKSLIKNKSYLVSLTHVHRKIIRTQSRYLPDGALYRFGCTNCEWRNEYKCPCYVVDEGISRDYPIDQICEHRLFWLCSIMPKYDTVPTFSRFIRDVNLGIIDIRSRVESKHLDKIQAEYDTLHETDPQSKELKDLYFKRLNNWNQWTFFVKKVIHYEDQQSGREQPKEVIHKHEATMSDVARLLNTKDVREAEFTVLEDDDAREEKGDTDVQKD